MSKATMIRPGSYRVGLRVLKSGKVRIDFVMKFYKGKPMRIAGRTVPVDELRSVPSGVKAEFQRGYF